MEIKLMEGCHIFSLLCIIQFLRHRHFHCIGTWLPILVRDSRYHQPPAGNVMFRGPYNWEPPPWPLQARINPANTFHQANCLGTARRSEHCALAFCLELQKEQPQTTTGLTNTFKKPSKDAKKKIRDMKIMTIMKWNDAIPSCFSSST